MGFFTDTSVCIGCKACEVACKEWNHVPEDGLNLLGMSYDNTGGLGASTWRHVAFIEQIKRPGDAPGPGHGQPDDSGGSVLTESALGDSPRTAPAGSWPATCASTAPSPLASTCARPAR